MATSPIRGKPQRTRISDIRRQELLVAALKCIAAKGYDRVTVADVATEAGMSKGTALYYFNTREELLTSAMETIWHDMEGLVRAIWNIPEGCDTENEAYKLIKAHYSDPDIDFTSVIRNGVKLLLSWFENSPHMITIALEFWRQVPRNPDVAGAKDKIQNFVRDTSSMVIAAGIRQGAFRKRNSQLAAYALISTISGFAFNHAFTWQRQFDTKKLERELYDLIVGYLVA